MSSVSEQIRPETLASIRALASSSGFSIDEYLRRLLLEDERNMALKSDIASDEFETDMIDFAEGSENTDEYNGKYSREDVYFDHD
jgi:hypothetical protein